MFSFGTLPGLWFHGMALVDPIGPGPVPLYDPGYPARAARAREDLAIRTPPLSGRIGDFRRLFRSDQAFEVLHFLPLYFPGAGRTEAFEALTELARTVSGPPNTISTRTRFGTRAIAAVLQTAPERRILGDFISALETEWSTFYGEYQAAHASEWRQAEAEIQDLWDGVFSAPLGPLLSTLEMEGGTVFLVPALGTEGRVFSGVPADQTDNVLAVTAPRSGESPRAALFAMIRELCFPLSREALQEGSSRETGPGVSEGEVGSGAVQAGAMILEEVLPEEVDEYQRFFLSRAGRRVPEGEPSAPAFQAMFTLEEGQLTALRDIINRSITDGGEF